MQQLAIAAIVGLVVGMIVVGVPAVMHATLRNRAFQKVCDAYERIIDKSDQRVADAEERLASYMDRWYSAKNLPPSEVDMMAMHNERRQREEERRAGQNGRTIPPRIGEVDRRQLEMEEGVKNGRFQR